MTGKNILLDDLVLLNCASHLRSVGRTKLEKVSRRLAVALLSINICKPTLIIHSTNTNELEVNVTVRGNTLILELHPLSEQIRLKEALLSIISRFKRFHRLKVHPELFGTFADYVNIPLASCQLLVQIFEKTTVQRLVITGFAEFNSSLIEQLAPSLKRLSIRGKLLQTDGWTKSLYSAVEKCTKLKSFHIGSHDRPTNSFEWAKFVGYLKTIRIRRFAMSNPGVFDLNKLAEALKDHQSLRAFVVPDYYPIDVYDMFFSTALLPIISQLRFFQIGTKSHPDDDVSDYRAEKLKQLLLALPENGSFVTWMTVQCLTPQLGRKMRCMRLSSNFSTGAYNIAHKLIFWLLLSDATARTIKLHLRFNTEPTCDDIKDVAKKLQETDEFHDLLMERVRDEKMILVHRNAQVSVSLHVTSNN